MLESFGLEFGVAFEENTQQRFRIDEQDTT
jgi:hypothetical protein